MELTTLFSFLNLFQWLFGGYWIIQGLNGFFHWFAIPFVSTEMDQFISEFSKVRGFMFTIKLIEILAGLLLLTGFARIFSWILFLPLIFGIIILHWNYNPRPAPMILFMSLFFSGLTYLELSNLINFLRL